MKKFAFSLDRVLDWREVQARMEESKLEALYAELRAVDSRKAELRRQRDEYRRQPAAAGGATGTELAALDAFLRFAVAEHTRLERLRADCSKRIAAQIQVVASKRRDVRLLERLKQRRVDTWRREVTRELDAEAGESYLAGLQRVRSLK